ncbi:hypothetical protein B0H66DRAFT_536420 [Apodospora peruviana]|uniref:RHS repeat-associated core domain-containing protein n=1 Tax=Apodospora peruviana TaxID=516989 RepID=A0AAE0HZL0_9PEZI|nr:hypothetical protein B0H66DRAFT_536420 [Apodospora peruviana]
MPPAQSSSSTPIQRATSPTSSTLTYSQRTVHIRRLWQLHPPQQRQGQGHEGTTYEGRPLDLHSGLFDFKARWYDPLFGRFATPDTILDEDSLKLVDGMNRYAFENNDPVNHIDPSGHWTSNFWLGALAAVGLAIVGLILTFATGGGFLIAV